VRILVNNGLLECSCGSTPASILVNKFVKIDGSPIVSENNCVPFVNIPNFGFCTILNGPCSPQTARWQNVAKLLEINGSKVVTSQSILPCSVGGNISVIEAGQSRVNVD